MVFRFILVLDSFFSSKKMRPPKYVNVLIIRQLFSYILTFLRVCIVCVYIQLQSIAIRSISTINRIFFIMETAFCTEIGVVFQLHTKEIILACSHCNKDFGNFTEFSLHVQEHLLQLWQQSSVICEDICDTDSLQAEFSKQLNYSKNERS